MEAVNERRGHRLVAEHGATPRLVRGERGGRPQRRRAVGKHGAAPADRQLADLDDQLRRVGERAKAAGQLSRRLRAFERFDQPGQGAAVDAAAVPGGDGAEPDEWECQKFRVWGPHFGEHRRPSNNMGAYTA